MRRNSVLYLFGGLLVAFLVAFSVEVFATGYGAKCNGKNNCNSNYSPDYSYNPSYDYSGPRAYGGQGGTGYGGSVYAPDYSSTWAGSAALAGAKAENDVDIRNRNVNRNANLGLNLQGQQQRQSQSQGQSQSNYGYNSGYNSSRNLGVNLGLGAGNTTTTTVEVEGDEVTYEAAKMPATAAIGQAAPTAECIATWSVNGSFAGFFGASAGASGWKYSVPCLWGEVARAAREGGDGSTYEMALEEMVKVTREISRKNGYERDRVRAEREQARAPSNTADAFANIDSLTDY